MIVLYVLESCPYCRSALQLLKENNLKHKSIVVENNEDKELYKKQNRMDTFPQVFLQVEKDSYMKLGGYDNLSEIVSICKSIKNTDVSMDSIYYMYKTLYDK